VKEFCDYGQSEAFVGNYKKQKEIKDSLEEDLDWWYAVARGRNGNSNVYPSWAEASLLVVEVSGSVVKKFRGFEDTMIFINCYQEAKSL
jgi:hypothetical protein